jgi:hypothetical protein
MPHRLRSAVADAPKPLGPVGKPDAGERVGA